MAARSRRVRRRRRPAASGGQGFGGALDQAIQQPRGPADAGASAAQSLRRWHGQATDPTSVVMAVERAHLAMQLASQIRTKAVEAYTDIFHTQV